MLRSWKAEIYKFMTNFLFKLSSTISSSLSLQKTKQLKKLSDLTIMSVSRNLIIGWSFQKHSSSDLEMKLINTNLWKGVWLRFRHLLTNLETRRPPLGKKLTSLLQYATP
jgi:hypothetical protein